MSLTVGAKMTLGYGLVLAMLGVVLFSGLSGLNRVTGIYEEQVLRIAENSRLAQEVAWHVVTESFSVAAFISTSDLSYRTGFDQAEAGAAAALARLKARSASERAHELVDRVMILHEEYARNARPLFDTFSTMTQAEFLQVVGGLDATRADLLETIEELIEYQAGRRMEQQALADAENAQARRLMYVFALVSLLAGGFAAVRVTRSVAGPAHAMARAAHRLADGDLTLERLEVRSGDEMGLMADAFNRMVNNLRSMLKGIGDASAELMQSGQQLAHMIETSAEATTQIAAAINQVAEGANQQASNSHTSAESAQQLRKAIEQIAAGAQHQAEQVQEINNLVHQMSAALAEVAAAAEEVAEDADEDLKTAQAGGDAVRTAVQGMERMRTRVDEVADRVHELGRLSQRIGEIVALISDIAEQTNLLALNAAIEAARAGEHGRGFAVVADEVRKLAESSSSSARQISELIETIQEGVQQAVAAVESGTQEAETGSQLAAQAGQALDQIVESVAKSSARARRIAEEAQRVTRHSEDIVRSVTEVASIVQENTASTEEMSAASVQVTDALGEISSVAMETAAAAEEVAASAEQVNENVARVRGAAAGLTRMADRLSGLVGRFTLPSND